MDKYWIQKWSKRHYIRDWKILDTIGECDICGKSDILHVVHDVRVCPRCFKKLNMKMTMLQALSNVVVTGPGICQICGRPYRYGFKIRTMYVCWKCLWHILGKHREPLKVGGSIITY